MDARSAIADTMMMAMSTAIAAVPRRNFRRLSDFSDIAHLTVAFDGIRLSEKQKQWIKNTERVTLNFIQRFGDHAIVRDKHIRDENSVFIPDDGVIAETLDKHGFKKWKASSKVTPGEWVHEYIRHKYPSVRAQLEKNQQLMKQHQQAITDIVEMAVESVDSLDDSLGPLLVSYASENGILEEREGFDRFYWARVSEALCQLSRHFPLRSHKWDTVSAWRIVILFIINKIEYGFQLETKSLKSQRSFDNPCYSKA